ncbi:hypothetical protein HYZ97_00070 [Candidatus Pacearchaeota archaeon]|nr:hypothetical protein [Candidatus Pacearchaeota archaeon]
MKRGEKLALFLGMLSGDGCLSIGHNGQGYRDYPIQFYNTEKEKVILFDDLFYNLFGTHGRIVARKRKNRKEIWEFVKYSVKTVKELRKIGFPEGVKRDLLRVLPIIKEGSPLEKLNFIGGVILTDGSIKPKRGILFHSGSKLFLEDLSILLSEFIGQVKPVKEFTQREIYKSYQLYLNKQESEIILGQRGTMVLRLS